jgi:hypothetical protein
MTGGADTDVFVIGEGGSDVVTDLAGGDFLELAPGVTVRNFSFANTDGAGALDMIIALSNGSVTVLNTGDLVTPFDLIGP